MTNLPLVVSSDRTVRRVPILALLLASAVLIAGCSGRAPRETTTPVTQIPAQGDWFCQMASGDSDGWDCVQDAELARHPQPERLPHLPDAAPDEPPAEEAPFEIPDDAASGSVTQATEPAATLDEEAAMADVELIDADRIEDDGIEADRTELDPIEAERAEAGDPLAEASDPLAAVPDGYYALQVAAHDTLADAQRFISERQVDGLLAVPVSRDGRHYYVVLLGTYPTPTDARQAAAAMPEALSDIEPWVRPVGPLRPDPAAGGSDGG